MNLWQAFKMAFKSISMKKTRSFLTMLGIIIGVASVVIMVSVVQGQNRQTMEMFEKLGDNKITVQAYGYYDTNNETSQKLYENCLTRYSPVWSENHSHLCLEQRELRLADRHAHQAGL